MAEAAATAVASRPARRFVEGFARVDRYVAGVEAVVAVLAMTGMLLLVAAPMVIRALERETIERYLGEGFDYSWMAQASRFLLTWATFAGASLATRARRHIVVDLVTKLIGLRARAFMGVFAALIAAGLCGTLTIVGAYVVKENWHHRTVLGWLNSGPAHIIVPIALAVMSVRYLVQFVEDLDGTVSGDVRYLEAIESGEAHGLSVADPDDEPAPEPAASAEAADDADEPDEDEEGAA